MKEQDVNVSRRDFLKWSALAASSTCALTACGKSGSDVIMSGGGGNIPDSEDPILSGGEWVAARCSECSQARCVNQVYMVDGIPLRQNTQDDHNPTTLHPTYQSCLKGRGMRFTVFSPDRLKYPMKRKNWNKGDPASAAKNTNLRGKDEWERITWEEAIDIMKEEFTRICQNYGKVYDPADTDYTNNPNGTYGIGGGLGAAPFTGNSPVMNMSFRETQFLNRIGYGSIPIHGKNSEGRWTTVAGKVAGNGGGVTGEPTTQTMGGYWTDKYDVIDNVKVIVLWSS
jgi:anaerobic selenocysteine-containing dehydrogenase